MWMGGRSRDRRRVVGRVDGRVDHCRIPIIVSPDPTRNVMRYRDIAVCAARGVTVPSRHPRHDTTHHRTRCPAHSLRSEIGIELVPRVTHWRKAIAKMPRAAWPDDRFGAAVAHADDEIETVEVELLDGRRKQRQVG